MQKQIRFSILALWLCQITRADEIGCTVQLPQEIPQNEPVYFVADKNGNYSLYQPTDSYLLVAENQILYMFCAGQRNSFNDADYNYLSVQCNENHEFEVDNVEVDFATLNCQSKSSGDVRLTKNRCAKDQGVLNEIGFQVTNSKFLKLFDVCYNNDTASPIYTNHYINGKAIEFHVRESNRRPFQNTGIPKTVNPVASYKQAAIEAHFSQLLGGNQKFFRGSKTLSRGHLAPDGDFIFRTEQFATYFYMNVVPQFQSINNGNWKIIENLVRKLAQKLKRDLLVYTGAYQQLELPDKTGNLVPLWLDPDNRIAVPKYIWKVVIDEKCNTGVAFVTLNNPYADKTEMKKICNDICYQTQIRSKGFERISSGYTYCCDVNELAKIIGVLPPRLQVRGLLKSS